jgi:hypothetical protein
VEDSLRLPHIILHSFRLRVAASNREGRIALATNVIDPMAPVSAAQKLNKLNPGTKVVSLVALPKVPEGSLGKVIFVSGLTWTRYWVLFENGERLGQIDRAKLATVEEWNARLVRVDTPGIMVGTALVAAGAGGGAAAADSGAAPDAKGKYGVPQLLIDRSARARERWAAKG